MCCMRKVEPLSKVVTSRESGQQSEEDRVKVARKQYSVCFELLQWVHGVVRLIVKIQVNFRHVLMYFLFFFIIQYSVLLFPASTKLALHVHATKLPSIIYSLATENQHDGWRP